jgi:hypothetical protein
MPNLFTALFRRVGLSAPPKPYKDEPCFVVRYDGEVTPSTLRTFSGGQMAVFCVIAWRECYPDGTITEEYSLARKWHRP